MAHQPNRRVRGANNREVNLHFSTTLLEELNDPDQQVQDEAQRVVCARYRDACKRKYGTSWLDDEPPITWDQLTISVIDNPNNPHPDVGEGGCGCECPRCDIGYHCYRRSTGCKQR